MSCYIDKAPGRPLRWLVPAIPVEILLAFIPSLL